MAMRESRMLEEVRRWRREVYERRKAMTPEERARADREAIERAGLSHLVKRTGSPSDARKRAG